MTRPHFFFAAALLVAVYWALFTPANYDGHVLIIGALMVGAYLPGRRRG